MSSMKRIDEYLAAFALIGMALIPLIEIISRPMMGSGFENGPLVVQHLGLVMAMFGAIAAERAGHLATLGRLIPAGQSFAYAFAGIVCGVLTWSSGHFVWTEMSSHNKLAYDVPVWWLQAMMPLGFLVLGFQLSMRSAQTYGLQLFNGLLVPLSGFLLARYFDGEVIDRKSVV